MMRKEKEALAVSEEKIKEYSKRYSDVVISDAELARLDALSNIKTQSPWEFAFRFSQPAHFVVLFIVIYLGFILFPKQPKKPLEPSTLSSILYLGSFATHFGMQMWMTFISGIVLFLTIPRHTFGQVQRQLFPKYFLFNSVLAFITLAMFLQHNPVHVWTTQQKTQVWSLCICFFIELVTRLYLVPPMLQTMHVRMIIEKEAGVGNEIGRHEPGRLRHCPHYLRLHRIFRRLHGATAMANMIALACNGIHLYHLATKLCTI